MTYDAWKLASDPELPEQAERINKPYMLVAADRLGVVREERFETFEEAETAHRHWRDEMDPHWHMSRHGLYAYRVTNIDRCDVNDDGLTDEERDQL